MAEFRRFSHYRKIERWHKSLKQECPGPLTAEPSQFHHRRAILCHESDRLRRARLLLQESLGRAAGMADNLGTKENHMASSVVYWRQGESVQNFGDYMTEFFLKVLFYGDGLAARNIRLIGSCIDDGLIDNELANPPSEDIDLGKSLGKRVVFWGCGLRREDGLSEANRSAVEILSVRGPLTRSALRLGAMVPYGDPCLILPALYEASEEAPTRGASVLVPHFHEHRPDDELLKISGCDLVLRPNIPNDLDSIRHFVDQVNAADFVLSASLHGAIAAAAYGRPFGFWDSGNIDLPFKWQDFAASVAIPCAFFANLRNAMGHYKSHVKQALRIPVLWPILAVAPFPVRMNVVVRVVESDIERHGTDALRAGVSERVATCIETERIHKTEAYEQLLTDFSRHKISEEALRLESQMRAIRLSERSEELNRMRSQLADRSEEVDRLRSTLTGRENELTRITSERDQTAAELEKLDGELNALRSSSAKEHQVLEEIRGSLDQALGEAARKAAQLDGARAEIHQVRTILEGVAGEKDEIQERFNQVITAKSWRVTAPLREFNRRYPVFSRNLQRLVKLIWWTFSLQLLQKARQKRSIRRQIALLSKSDLLDKRWYLEEHQDVAAANLNVAEHFFWFGAAAGYDPHPLFDTDWYVEQYPDVAQSGLNPLVHYLRIGAVAAYDPHPLFDASWYIKQRSVEIESGENALLSYLRAGASGQYDPNPWFDNDKYVFEYPEVSQLNQSPLLHYVLVGSNKHYDPHPLFDSRWYRTKYTELLNEADPLVHYLTVGKKVGCLPSLLFENQSCRTPTFENLCLLTSDDPDVSIIIPVYRHYFYTYRCLCSIMSRTSSDLKYEVIVADDCPDQHVAVLLENSSGVRVELNQNNLGFLRNCNNAAKRARGRFILFLNNDTIVGENWLTPLIRTADSDPSVGMVGCKLLNTDGTIQEAGGIIFNDGWGLPYGAGDDPNKSEYNYVRQVDCIIGACFLVRRDLFEELGGFDLSYAPAFYEEFDLAFAGQQRGYKVIYQPATEVTHLRGQSYGAETRDAQSRKNRDIFVTKWQRRLSSHPSRDENLFIAREPAQPRGIILVIDDKSPEYDKHAGALTLYQYLQLLQSLGLRVIFCPERHEPLQPYTSVLQQQGIEVVYPPERLEDWLQQNGRYLDYVWTARPDVTARFLNLIKTYTCAKVLYYAHDLHYLRELRRYGLEKDPWALEESNRLREIEFDIFRKVDCVMTPSTEEVTLIQQAIPTAHVRDVLPYFFPPDAIAPTTDFAVRKDMIFVGGYGHTPNVDAAVWLVKDILPLVWKELPTARLMIVGSNPPDSVKALQNERVEVLGYVPDLTPYYDRSRVSVNPLRYGAGVKGKIVGSLRAGVPVITTSVGNEGIGLRDGVEALIADSAQAIAENIVVLYRSDRRCQSLADAGRSVIRRQFSTMKARRIINEILSDEICVLCGEPVGERSPVVDGGAWYDLPGCRSCGASNLVLMLANVVLEPFRRPGVDNFPAAVEQISRLHIYDSGLLSSSVAATSHGIGIPTSSSPTTLFGRDLRARNIGLLESPDACPLERDYDLIISPDWKNPSRFSFEGVIELAGRLSASGRLITTALDISGVQAAWRSLMFRAPGSHRGNEKSRSMVIHEVAPAGLNPYVCILELRKRGEQ